MTVLIRSILRTHGNLISPYPAGHEDPSLVVDGTQAATDRR